MGCVYSRVCICETCVPKATKTEEGEHATASEVPVFSLYGRGEIRNEVNQSGINNDLEVDITGLSSIFSQFPLADGSRTVKVPSKNYELQYSCLSQRGYYPDAPDKANQDSFCVHTPFGMNPDNHFFGVFDGHGEFGAQCSEFTKLKLSNNFLGNLEIGMDAVEAYHAAFLLTNSQLHDDIVNDSMSGTTAITILVQGQTIHVANCGDSRAVIAERRGNRLIAVDLSKDHTPFREDELKRVKHCGARVLNMDQIEGIKNPDVQCWGTEGVDSDPPRLWVQDGMYPGTAFTRSIGDSIAETIGVVATPEIVVLELTPSHPFFVIASDGVFEFLSSQSVVDMVARFKNPCDACAAVVAESHKLWLQYETRTDDITVAVVQINDLSANVGGQSESDGAVLWPPLPQVVEVMGFESLLDDDLSSKNHYMGPDLLRACHPAIESSLEIGQVWNPESMAHWKTMEEEAHMKQALHGHFLFKKLNDSRFLMLLDCMEKVQVKPKDVVAKQGSEGGGLYIVGSGEFEALAAQGDKNGEMPGVLQRYTDEKLPSFGELALMYNKPLEASVLAAPSVILWALKREDFLGIVMSGFSNLASLKLLLSVNLLSKYTILQLSHMADSLSKENSIPCSSLFSIEKVAGSSFGDVVCAVLTKESIDAVNPLTKASQFDHMSSIITKANARNIDPSRLAKVLPFDLEWIACLCSTDCSEIGLVSLRNSGKWSRGGASIDGLNCLAWAPPESICFWLQLPRQLNLAASGNDD